MRWRGPALAALLGGIAAPAQERSFVHHVDGREVVAVRVVPFVGSAAPGGLGFLVVQAENRDDAVHVVHVDCGSHASGASRVGVQRELRLGPREFGRCFLPLPTTRDHGLGLDVTIDGVVNSGSVGAGRRDGMVGLLVSARSDAEAWGLTVMRALAPSAKEPAQVTLAPPDDLPADWRLFTGFHAVLVDGRARVADDVQAALAQFAAAGGTVVVGDADRLPAGALRDRCGAAAADGRGRVGLGHCVPVAGGGDTTVLRERLAGAVAGWPAPAVLLREQVVPGLGEAPVLVFLSVILLFAVVVGPVNFLLLRRWRRPLLVLLTVPACGIGTTLAMLGYGLVHDGLGVRGVVRSWTLLDQDRHEATSLAARTLFAGLSPAALQIASDGFVVSPRASLRHDLRAPDRWQFDPAASALDGGVLPSRIATPLLSARHGLARQRLRARRDGDRLELLVDGGVQPVGEVLLRDFEGRLWVGAAPVLLPATEITAPRALAAWQRAAAVLTVRDAGGDDDAELAAAHGLVERLLGGDELARGSYVARVAAAPWLDEHGLTIAYDAAEHFVVGRLAAEDFVR